MTNDAFFSVFLDANVIRGMETTDTILTLARAGLFDVRWSDYVLEEAIRNRPPGLPLKNIQARTNQMNVAFPAALVDDYEHLIEGMPADRKDQPVLAAAMHAGATTLVTENDKDFWPGMLATNSITCVSTSELLRPALKRAPEHSIDALQQRISRNRRPPHSFPDYLDRLVGREDLAPFARALNTAVPAALRGTDPRLEVQVPELSSAARALAGTGSIANALKFEVERSRRYPRARAWAARRPGPNRGVER